MGTFRARLKPRRQGPPGAPQAIVPRGNGQAPPPRPRPAAPVVVGLTGTEITILRWLSVGKRYADIALIMGMTEGALQVRAHRIMDKLGTPNATGAVGIALRRRIIE